MADKPTEQLVYRSAFSSQMVYVSKNEIDILKSNRHPNVISLVTMYDNNMILPAFPGGSLEHFITEAEHFTEDETFFTFYQLISGLQYLHKKGIVHRGASIKSRIVIADFGLALYKGEAEKVHHSHGTFGYFAPEVVTDKRYSSKSDCWAAGLILLSMIFVAHPFAKYLDNKQALTDAILNAKVDFDALKENTDLLNLVSSLLHVDPDQRHSASQCLQSSWVLKKTNRQFFSEYEEMVLQHFAGERKIWFDENFKDKQTYLLNDIPLEDERPHYHVDHDPLAVADIKYKRRELKKDCFRIETEKIISTSGVIEDWIDAINKERFPNATLIKESS
ncbi:hypothetical protein RO3G_10451 [Rhizopus delemar RA 99-880]|uniref:Protein kinase domain-containing protein n=1 Tax=Rhizopus delemar (strain RA 99-880 / ATCC MYA-4621 / FGSC 9543 / NRRL 43880) TaxID=246409 RepID=I1CBB1_RHIO9|nr:hypothetical protein RO3G_10451 [Rhizopus delemar RA 99-880]|eukprot:EIE85741.1 hypothetical protein RO3G_10451 [Rhizopus delemar RA 99-880]